MTQDELISKQALRIAELEEEVTDHRARVKAISMIIYGVGGPLNDNKLGYTKLQLGPFGAIVAQLD